MSDYEFGQAVRGDGITSLKGATERKNMPVFNGVLKYFPLALLEISKVSKAGNDQHNAGQPLQWDKTKSIGTGDEVVRHLLDHARGIKYDTDGIRHLGKFAWRALELLQRELEAEQNNEKK